MVRKYLALLIVLASFINVTAQKRIGNAQPYLYKEPVTIDMELTLDEYLPGEMLWAFGEYTDAKVIMKNGTEARARINFNFYTNEVFFISPESEPMALANTGDVRRILFEDAIWLPYNEIFGKQIYRQGSYAIVRLLQTRILTYRKSSKVGELTRTVSPMSTYTLPSLQATNQQRMTLALGEYVFVTTASYIIISEASAARADRGGFRKSFPTVKKEINSYLKSNKVDFWSEEEVISMLKMCIDLTDMQ
jgi:hypothetical protein